MSEIIDSTGMSRHKCEVFLRAGVKLGTVVVGKSLRQTMIGSVQRVPVYSLKGASGGSGPAGTARR